MLTREQAIEIARKFQQTQHNGVALKVKDASLRESHGTFSPPREVWGVVFELNAHFEDPDICIVEVDAETGEARFFEML